MCLKKKKFTPHCQFFDCMEFGPNEVKEHTCEECRYWVDSPEKVEYTEKHIFDELYGTQEH